MTGKLYLRVLHNLTIMRDTNLNNQLKEAQNRIVMNQLELINQTLAELQAQKMENKPRNPIGFIKPKK